jgi:hypothetical protein
MLANVPGDMCVVGMMLLDAVDAHAYRAISYHPDHVTPAITYPFLHHSTTQRPRSSLSQGGSRGYSGGARGCSGNIQRRSNVGMGA